jgi:hypothetical protein
VIKSGESNAREALDISPKTGKGYNRQLELKRGSNISARNKNKDSSGNPENYNDKPVKYKENDVSGLGT